MFHICNLVKLLQKQQNYVIYYKGVQISKLPQVAKLLEMEIFGMWFLIFFIVICIFLALLCDSQ